jgi:hypothetical protein
LKEIFITREALPNRRSLLCSMAGRGLILLAAVVLVAMPWTEYYWQFDNFLRGGQDMELGVLAVVSILCLVLIFLHDNKARVTFIAAILRRLIPVSERVAPIIPISFSVSDLYCDTTPPLNSSLDLYNLPIQI